MGWLALFRKLRTMRRNKQNRAPVVEVGTRYWNTGDIMGRFRRSVRESSINRQAKQYIRSARGKLKRFEARLPWNCLHISRPEEQVSQADIGTICWIDHLDAFGIVLDTKGDMCDIDVGVERRILHRSDVRMLVY